MRVRHENDHAGELLQVLFANAGVCRSPCGVTFGSTTTKTVAENEKCGSLFQL